MKLRRHRARLPFWAIADAPVWYQPVGSENRHAAVIEGNPWFAPGSSTWMARLRKVDISPGASIRVAIAAVEVPQLRPRRIEAGSA